MREKKQLLHDYEELKKEKNLLELTNNRLMNIYRELSAYIRESPKCSCGGKLFWFFDEDNELVSGKLCSLCGKKWWL